MKIVELNRNNSILNQYLAEIRDVIYKVTACVSAAISNVSGKSWHTKSAVIFLINRWRYRHL